MKPQLFQYKSINPGISKPCQRSSSVWFSKPFEEAIQPTIVINVFDRWFERQAYPHLFMDNIEVPKERHSLAENTKTAR